MPKYLTSADLMEMLQLSKASAYRMMDEAGATRIGGLKRLSEPRLRAYLDANTEKSLAEHLAEV